jgi:hypothetical protein
VARPTKLTPETHAKIVSLIRAGNFRETAAASAGIDSSTLRDWLRRGAKGEEPYATLSRDLDVAEADAEVRDVLIIGKAAGKDWRAAQWRLAVRSPERWAKAARVELSGRDGGAIRFDATKLTDAELLAIATGAGAGGAGAAEAPGEDGEPSLVRDEGEPPA